MAQILTTLTFALHILSGMVAMASGLIAICVRKGGRIHRAAGDVFVVSMLIMAVFAAVLGIIRPGQIINAYIAGFTIYLVSTSWLAARRRDAVAGVPEKIALVVSLVLWVPFALMIFQIATGVILFKSAFVIKGPMLIALCVFTAIITIAAMGDLRVVLGNGLTEIARITRHLWRMCFGLTMALGSASTNGFARLLPGPYHVPPAFFLPPLSMLVVLLYWVIRVRFPGWRGGVPSQTPNA